MKNLLPFIFCSFSFGSYAQIHTIMPTDAITFYNNAMQSIKPEIKNLIETNADKLKNRKVNSDSLASELKKDNLLKGINQHDIDAIAVLIMVQASNNADTDLKNLVMKIHKTSERNSPKTYKKTETIQEYKSQIAKTVSKEMKKISPSQESAINNLR